MSTRIKGLRYAYLTYVSGQGSNNNKFYEMEQLDDELFRASWGRVSGSRKPQTKMYRMYQWNKKLDEKLRKGYDDITHLRTVQAGSTYEPDLTPGGQLLTRLMDESRQLVQQNYTVAIANVTSAMIAEANKILNNLSRLNQVYLINRQLEQLFRVLPREMANVPDYLIEKLHQKPNVIQREREVLDAMETQVQTRGNGKTVPEALGVTIEPEDDPATLAEIARLLGCQSGSLRVVDYSGGTFAPVKRVYRLTKQEDLSQLAAFSAQLGPASQGKMLWHGSRNENWASILKLGLRIQPSNAHQTGSMFGSGVYFASRAMKSANYTSYRGAYWARGSSDYSVLALYEVDIGRPYEVKAGQNLQNWMQWCDFEILQRQGQYHSIWAREGMNYSGTRLLNDELIVYRDNQFAPRYLLELGA